jgi:hypothetical protein
LGGNTRQNFPKYRITYTSKTLRVENLLERKVSFINANQGEKKYRFDKHWLFALERNSEDDTELVNQKLEQYIKNLGLETR